MLPWIDTLLLSNHFNLTARLVLTSFFWIAGLFGLMKFNMIVASVRRANLPWPTAIAGLMIATELGGSLLLVTNWQGLGWVGAGWLGVFTFLSIPLGHPFWKFEQPRRMEEFQIAAEHVAVVGGLMCAAALLVR